MYILALTNAALDGRSDTEETIRVFDDIFFLKVLQIKWQKLKVLWIEWPIMKFNSQWFEA